MRADLAIRDFTIKMARSSGDIRNDDEYCWLCQCELDQLRTIIRGRSDCLAVAHRFAGRLPFCAMVNRPMATRVPKVRIAKHNRAVILERFSN